MTREEIIRMALEAGMSFNQSLEELNTPFCDGVHCEEFERFAKLVAVAEREAVLDLVDEYAKNNTDLRDAIRARGQA